MFTIGFCFVGIALLVGMVVLAMLAAMDTIYKDSPAAKDRMERVGHYILATGLSSIALAALFITMSYFG